MTRFLTTVSVLTTTFLTVAAPLAAQGTAVFPGDHADPSAPRGVRLGETRISSRPLSNGISRQMFVYESWDLDIPNGARIDRIGFLVEPFSTLASRSVRVQIFMGPSTRDAASTSTTYAQNYSAPRIEVFTPKIYTLPAVTSQPDRVPVWIPLDTPYVYDANQNLVIEYVVDANNNGNAAFSYTLDAASYLSPVSSFGMGCQTSSGQTPELESLPTYIGGTWNLDLRRAPASSTVFANVGLDALATPFPIPGAPGCDGLVAPLATGTATTGTSGTYRWQLRVPNDLAFYGAELFTQVLALDLFANSAGVVASNGDRVQFGVPPRCAVVSNRGDLSQTTGSVNRSVGLLTRFEWRP